MTLRVGIAGFGRRGKSHIAALQDEPRARLTAISDPDSTAQNAAREQYSQSNETSIFASPEKMVDSGEIDAVIVAAPAHLNRKVAEPILERGIPTLIEKPPGLSATEVIRLRNLAERNDARVMVAFNRRFNPLVRKAIHEIHAAGNIYQIVAEFHKDIDDFLLDKRFSPQIMDLMLMESPIHAIDLVIHLADSPVSSVQSIVKRADTEYRDLHAALIEFQNGIVCQFTAAYTAGGRLERYEIHGKRISAYLEGIHQGWILQNNTRREIEIPTQSKSDIQLQDSHFVNSILDQTPFAPHAADLDSSLETITLCEKILAGTT